MRSTFRNILVLLLAVSSVLSCIRYDMSYPRILAAFEALEVEGAEEVLIDKSSRTVSIEMNEQSDLSAVKVDSVALTEKAFFKDGNFPEILDLTSPYEVMLRLYHDYRWTIKGTQSVERYIRCVNQVGDAVFYPDRKEAFVYVSNSQRLRDLRIEAMKLELDGSLVKNSTGKEYEGNDVVTVTHECEFPMTLDCTDQRTFTVLSRGEEIVWNFTVIPVEVPAQITDVAAWCSSADVFATFDGTSEPPMLHYKKTSDEEWIVLPQDSLKVDGINIAAHIGGLEMGTSYDVKLLFNGEELPGRTFVTDTPVQLPNMNFDRWWLSGKVWYPYFQNDSESDKVWDSANPGAAQFIGSSTLPEYEDVVNKGAWIDEAGVEHQRAAVKMVSKWAAVKFAAGNLYTGKFNGLVGLSGADLDWGVPFTSKPKALKGWYKYQPAAVNYKNNVAVSGSEMDRGQIQILLIETDCPYNVLPVNGANGPTYKDKNKIIDLESDQTIIARGEMKLDLSDVDNDGKADWVEFVLPFEYRDNRTPTYVVVTAASSYLGDFFTGGDGSTLLIDEFEFIYSYSFNE